MLSQLIKSMIFLLSFLALFVPNVLAQDEEALPEFPFEFIPEIFQGIWVLDNFFYPPIALRSDTPPEPYLGRIIQIENRTINIFGYHCDVDGIRVGYNDHTRRDSSGNLIALKYGPYINPIMITDEDIESYYPFSMFLFIFCEGGLMPTPQGDDALFLGSDDNPRRAMLTLKVYSGKGHFLTTQYFDGSGPEYILRPVKKQP